MNNLVNLAFEREKRERLKALDEFLKEFIARTEEPFEFSAYAYTQTPKWRDS